MKIISGISLILSMVACTDTTPYPQVIVQNQASYDFDCPSSQIKVAPIGNHRFVAEGCFKREIYSCSSGMFLPDSSIECRQQITPLPSIGTGKKG